MHFMRVLRARRRCCCLLITGLIITFISCRSRSRADEPTASQPSPAEAIAQADQLYAGREDLTRVRQAIALLRQAKTNDFGSYEAAWRLSKFDYYLATHADGDERDKAFREGIEAGKEAVRLEAGKPDGHFWLGANYGGSVEKGGIAGLATVDDIRNEMNEVLKIDEGYQNGSAYMVLGLVDLKAPKLLGGDPQRAVEEMEKGLRFGETNAFLRLHLAEAYQKAGRQADARKQLDAIINMTPDPNYLPEYKEAVTQARQMLDQSG
jgi:tetratricopeptide (TPR) repeat protein